MSPICSKAAVRFLISLLLASSIANAAALPHQVVDSRSPLTQPEDVSDTNEAISRLAVAAQDDPKNFFAELSKTLNSYTGWQILRDFWARLFGERDDEGDDDSSDQGDDSDDSTVTTTIYVTPTPAEMSSMADEATPTPEVTDVILPPGPSSISIDVPTSTPTSEEPSTTSETGGEVMSILPVGDLSTAINATFVPPVFVTTPETTEVPTSIPTLEPVVPPFPLNATTTVGLIPTAVTYTEEFSVWTPVGTAVYVPPGEDFTAAPVGTGIQLPWSGNSSISTSVPLLILTNPIRPTLVGEENGLNTTSTTLSLTSVILVTETLTPSPVPGTGVPSVGTGLPIAVSEIPTWANTTFVIPTILPGTGTGSLPVGTGLPAANSEIPTWANTTFVAPILLPGTGTASPSAGTAIPIVESPLYPNTTSATSDPTFVIPVPVTVTGAPGTVLNVSVTIPIPPFPNTTYVLPAISLGTGTAPIIPGTGTAAAPSAGTALPLPATDEPLYPNSTFIAPTVLPGTGTAAPSAGTGSPIYFSDAESALYPNTTTATDTTLIFETATTTLILPSIPAASEMPVEDSAVEFPGLIALRTICRDPQIRVVTLPLLNRFYGPNAYPSLYQFPGCTGPNPRQSIQAPGLLDCSALGAEVQRCQAGGKKVLLSVKADGLSSVGGNSNFGDPNFETEPFGPAFAAEGGIGEEAPEKRQIIGNGQGGAPVEIDVEDLIASLVGTPVDNSVGAPVATPMGNYAEPPNDVSVDTPTILPLADFPEAPVEDPIIAPSVIPIDELIDPPVDDSINPLVLPIAAPLVDPIEDVINDVIDAPIEDPVGPPELVFNLTGPVIMNDTESGLLLPAPVPISLPPPVPVLATPLSDPVPLVTDSPIQILPFPPPGVLNRPRFPNLFDESHPPSSFALTLFSLFGEGHTERADLRPLGPDTPSGASPIPLNGTDWINPILTALQRPLGEEVVVDGFDVQLPAEWKGTYQDRRFKQLVVRLRELNKEAWRESGGVEGGPGDLGANGRGVVYFGWIGGPLKARGATLRAPGWVEWDGRQ